MASEFLLERFRQYGATTAIVWRDETYSYDWLLSEIDAATRALSTRIQPGTAVALLADFSPRSIAFFLALEARRCILIPVTERVNALQHKLMRLSHAEAVVALDDHDAFALSLRGPQAVPSLYTRLRERGESGLALFTSGSSGLTKVAVHSMVGLLAKFQARRHRLTALSFLLYDHIGGVNTMLYVLSNGGSLVTVPDRRPDTVAQAIARHHVELLPTSPTFLNLFLLSRAHKTHDISSLTRVTYGTERMHEHLLTELTRELPGVVFQQTYGLSEVGILRSKSESSGSLWVQLGGAEFDWRIVNDKLEVKALSAMLGYTNAASPFTEDGWFRTGDRVERKGEYLRILGRDSDLINVGGVNVAPAEVENVLIADRNVAEVRVYGRPTDLGGELCADVRVIGPEPVDTLLVRLRRACAAELSENKVPTRITIVPGPLHNERFKTGVFHNGGRPGARVGFVLSGQGPSWPKTGMTLFRQEAVFRETLEEFDALLESLNVADWSLLELLSTESGHKALDSTDKGQPAHFAYHVGLARLWATWGVRPAAVVGHSMGEVASAHIAGALSFEDAIRVVVHRASITQRAVGKGKMATVSLTPDRVTEALHPWRADVSLCAHNEPLSCVVAGETDSLRAFIEAAQQKGIRASLLPFDYAFHSPIMWPLRQELVHALSGIQARDAAIPIASTVRSTFLSGDAFTPEYWGDNICKPVRFVDGVNLLVDAACDVLLGIGPHSLLVGATRECLAHRGYGAPVLHSLRRHSEDLAELALAREALRALDLELG